jgi:hypothetical protein
LSRLRAAGRRVASASVAMSSTLRNAARSQSGRSGISMLSGAGGKTVKLGPDCGNGIDGSGPLGEAAEREATGEDVAAWVFGQSAQATSGRAQDAPSVVQFGAAAAAAARPQLKHRRRQSQAQAGPWPDNRAAPTASLFLGAPPPPFVFPEILQGEEEPRGTTAPAAATGLGTATAPVGAVYWHTAAAALTPGEHELVDLLVIHQQQREQRLLRLQAKAAQLGRWLSPAAWWPLQWHTTPTPQGGSRSGASACTAAPGRVAAAEEDGSYSWWEFRQTLHLIGLDPQGRLIDCMPNKGGGGRSSGMDPLVMSTATQLPAQRRAVARALGEGTEGGSGTPQGSGTLGQAPSFKMDLDSLIAEAEEVTGTSESSIPAPPCITLTAAQPYHQARPPGESAPQHARPRAHTRTSSTRVEGEPSAEQRNGGSGSSPAPVAMSGPGSSPVTLNEAPTPHIEWQRLGDLSDSPAGAPPTSAGTASVAQMATERFKSPRGGRVSFMTDSMKKRAPGPTSHAPWTADAPDFLGAALASLGQSPAANAQDGAAGNSGGGCATGGPAAGGSKGSGWGGVRFSSPAGPAGACTGIAKPPLGEHLKGLGACVLTDIRLTGAQHGVGNTGRRENVVLGRCAVARTLLH